MRPRLALALLLLATPLAAGCGRGAGTTPDACLEGSDTYLTALAALPGGPVKLRDEASISECLVENQGAGDLIRTGKAMLSTAMRLNGEARAHPGAGADFQVGYLVGAAQRGAGDNEGIDTELVRHLVAAATYSPDNRPLPSEFKQAYREGFDAGQAEG